MPIDQKLKNRTKEQLMLSQLDNEFQIELSVQLIYPDAQGHTTAKKKKKEKKLI